MAHTFRSHYFHLIWSTKGRKPFITPDIQLRLYSYMGAILKNNKAHLIEIGGVKDHVHLLISIPNLDGYSTVIRQLKSNSSVWMHKEFIDKKDFEWQDGYGSFAVSYSQLEPVIAYIKNQETHHARLSFKDEYIAFLTKHHIAYDPRFVFD